MLYPLKVPVSSTNSQLKMSYNKEKNLHAMCKLIKVLYLHTIYNRDRDQIRNVYVNGMIWVNIYTPLFSIHVQRSRSTSLSSPLSAGIYNWAEPLLEDLV